MKNYNRMNKSWVLVSVAAIVALIVSCTKLEDTPQFALNNAAFSISTSTSTVAISAKDSLSEALSLSWNDPKYAKGLVPKFSIVVGASGKNFAVIQTKNFASVSDKEVLLSAVLLGKEINAMALKLGGSVGKVVSLDVKVVSSLTNNSQEKTSNVVQISVTPYGDLSLSATSTKIKTSAATSSKIGDTLSWNVAFNGYNGVKVYQLQYAKGGTNFLAPTSTVVTAFSKTYTQLDLNKLALGFGTVPGADGLVDFRVKATNESNDTIYSNVVTLTITTYVASNSIGIIGDATAGGWSTDTDLYRPDPINKPGDWTTKVYLIGGKSAKFRADDDWVSNWGASDFPSGTGLQNGANINVSNSGYYQVDFNSGTGAYTFTALTTTAYAKVSVIGDATPGGWGADTELTQSTDPNVWTGTVSMTGGKQFKFRANDDWGANWGISYITSTGLSGWGKNNGDNISVTNSSTYFVYINTATGEFFFGDATNNASAGTAATKLGIIGDGTPGGWGADTFLTQNPTNPYKWSGKVALTAASAKFRADAAWTTSWGGSTFPNGIGTTKNDPNIPVTAGTAQITFNTATGEYSFSF
jgi:hypothetical protein